MRSVPFPFPSSFLLDANCSGEMLGKDQPVILQLLEIPGEGLKRLTGVEMELDDSAFPLVKGVIPTSDPLVAFGDADYALLVGARPRGPGMERKDLLTANAKIFQVRIQMSINILRFPLLDKNERKRFGRLSFHWTCIATSLFSQESLGVLSRFVSRLSWESCSGSVVFMFDVHCPPPLLWPWSLSFGPLLWRVFYAGQRR